jgi:hypothetical protein
MADKTIKVRVIGPSYGFSKPAMKGDVIEVTERELAAAPHCLRALDDEKKQEAPGVTPAERKRIESDRAKQEGWKKREADADRMLREHHKELAQQVIDRGGIPAAAPAKKAG